MLNTVKAHHSLPRKRQISSEFILYKVANDVSITIQFLSHLDPNTSPDMSYAQQLVMCSRFWTILLVECGRFSVPVTIETRWFYMTPLCRGVYFFYDTTRWYLCHIYSVFRVACSIFYIKTRARYVKSGATPIFHLVIPHKIFCRKQFISDTKFNPQMYCFQKDTKCNRGLNNYLALLDLFFLLSFKNPRRRWTVVVQIAFEVSWSRHSTEIENSPRPSSFQWPMKRYCRPAIAVCRTDCRCWTHSQI